MLSAISIGSSASANFWAWSMPCQSSPEHPAVINGCSDLFVEVFGERGRHARSSVGMSSLPSNMTVEIEAIVEFAQAA
jgi:enamine deaminase RidA (YjgF/YER057c/UK114 family)